MTSPTLRYDLRRKLSDKIFQAMRDHGELCTIVSLSPADVAEDIFLVLTNILVTGILALDLDEDLFIEVLRERFKRVSARHRQTQ